jgi:hypothetical protein
VDYDEPGRNLELKIKGGFATMLSVFKNCEQCYGPSYLHCIWRNNKYLENTTVSVFLNDAAIIGGIFFRNIEKHQAQQIQGMEHDLQFILEGVIGGLSDGRISLHPFGSLLKKCDADSERQDQKYPITLRVVSVKTDEIIARFNMFWER